MSAQSGFQDPFNYQFQATPQEYTNIDSVWGKIGQGLGLVDRNEYDRWLTEQERNYERASINSARAWEEYMDSTKYQRQFKDLKEAGVNPYLALSSGVSAGGSGSSVSTGGSARYKSTKHSDNKLNSLAMFMIGAAKLISALAL